MAIDASSRMKEFNKLCETFGVGGMTLDVLEESVKIHVHLRKLRKPIEDADIFVAAFCIANDYTLATNNTKHFQNIDRLKIANWKK